MRCPHRDASFCDCPVPPALCPEDGVTPRDECDEPCCAVCAACGEMGGHEDACEEGGR